MALFGFGLHGTQGLFEMADADRADLEQLCDALFDRLRPVDGTEAVEFTHLGSERAGAGCYSSISHEFFHLSTLPVPVYKLLFF
jgi:hypothetical protein